MTDKTNDAPAAGDDDFDAAFNEAINAIETPPAEPAPAAAPAAEPAKPAEPAPAAAPAAEPAKPAEPAPAPVDLEKEFPDPVLSKEDSDEFAKFVKDWPDQAAIMEKREKYVVGLLEARFARTVASMTQKVYEDFAPFMQAAAASATKSFRAHVLEQHPDFDTIKPQLSGWIAKQPAYLRDAYTRVYNEGNAEEVADLATRFKEATGVKPQAPSPAAQPQSPANDRKADDLAPVSTKRAVPAPKGPDLNNFDDAFEEAAQAAVPTR